MKIGGGPNMDAYEFNPRDISKEQLIKDGYYENYDAWIAGTRIKKIESFIINHIQKATSGE